MITDKQKEVLELIDEFIKSNGYPPTRLEVANEMGFTVNAAECHIKALIKKGYISCKPKIARSLRVLSLDYTRTPS